MAEAMNMNEEFLTMHENNMSIRKYLRSDRMQKKELKKKKKEKKAYRLICVFPEDSSGEEKLKNEVSSILRMELRNQIAQRK
ncbi:MAG TPA: hypothetical protein H9747_05365 [Candidatus Blautia stercorigallinarum]|uniref:Uncharacterized protein n=1 Tax=Candidatus Blautia stercorigallinarum TaxID=2838501 RepID=A0A9D1TF00_9FIRM|nr:hypothetical protein [Candidatus Blautia stercorigallinarum]